MTVFSYLCVLEREISDNDEKNIQFRQISPSLLKHHLTEFNFSRPSTIPQVIAAIAAAELPNKQWPELIPALVNNVNGVGNLYNRQIEIQLGGSVSTRRWHRLNRKHLVSSEVSFPIARRHCDTFR